MSNPLLPKLQNLLLMNQSDGETKPKCWVMTNGREF